MIKFGQIFLVYLLFLLSYGCAPTVVQMAEEERVRLKNEQEILAVHYTPPSLIANEPRSVLDDMFGGGGLLVAAIELAAAKSAGDQIVKDYSIEDPALRVKDKFLSTMEANLGFKNIRSIKEALAIDDPIELKEKVGLAIVLDFLTWEWGLWGEGLFRGYDYRLGLRIRSRLVRLKDSKILWQGVCRFDESVPRLQELKANNGAVLKQRLSRAADTCAAELIAQFYGKEKP